MSGANGPGCDAGCANGPVDCDSLARVMLSSGLVSAVRKRVWPSMGRGTARVLPCRAVVENTCLNSCVDRVNAERVALSDLTKTVR